MRRFHGRHSGAMPTGPREARPDVIEPGISRFRVRSLRSRPGMTKRGIPEMLVRTAALALTICALALPAKAADYPDHAIKMIVPFAAGGGTDVLARIIADNLHSKWGQPVVVENQPGASGAIG